MIEALDQAAGEFLLPLAVWVIISGLDDLLIAAVWLWRGPFSWPSEEELAQTPRKRIAIVVPLWREDRVIGDMLSHNVAAIRYDDYDFFIGAYPNDPLTIEAVRAAGQRFAHVHLALCPHDGPTTKADCLNWIYQSVLRYEQEHNARFEILVTHDAEDLIHPESLRLINYYSSSYDMVQVPVLPLQMPFWNLTHGLYCDEFAELHTKDVPVRPLLGGFIPSCGAGTGFTRAALDALARERQNRVFEPECLTEDYENGLAVYKMNRPQIFLPVHRRKSGFVATREYFPRTFRSAVKQRARWTVGISLQSWERHGWGGTWGCLWCFLHDRKSLLGNLLSPVANLILVYGLIAWLARGVTIGTELPRAAFLGAAYIASVQVGLRVWCSGRVYGWAFGLAAPLRAIWGNWLNAVATLAAFHRYLSARIRQKPLVWGKTEHVYPDRRLLLAHKRKIGEILVDSGYLSASTVEAALRSCPAGKRIGQHMVDERLLSAGDLCRSLSLQHDLPAGVPLEVSRAAARAIPARVAREWQILPFRIADGELHVAGCELPGDGVRRELRRFCSLEARFRLVTPGELDRLLSEHLPDPANRAPAGEAGGRT